jgi:hypothetical protein
MRSAVCDLCDQFGFSALEIAALRRSFHRGGQQQRAEWVVVFDLSVAVCDRVVGAQLSLSAMRRREDQWLQSEASASDTEVQRGVVESQRRAEQVVLMCRAVLT